MLNFLRDFLPIVIVASLICSFTVAFIIAWFALKKSRDDGDDRERKISDKELFLRLLQYVKPHWKSFIVVFAIMLVSACYDVVSPLLMKWVLELIAEDFVLSELFSLVILYASILAVSLVCTYLQAMLLQRIGLKILSQLRMDTFTHIEKLSHTEPDNIQRGYVYFIVAARGYRADVIIVCNLSLYRRVKQSGKESSLLLLKSACPV